MNIILNAFLSALVMTALDKRILKDFEYSASQAGSFTVEVYTFSVLITKVEV